LRRVNTNENANQLVLMGSDSLMLVKKPLNYLFI
jgi:hypothetical protein